MIKNYRYCLITADLDCGVKEHPQTQMKNLGFHVIKSEPVPIADCWWFRVDNEIYNIPPYLTDIGDNMKFSDEL